MQDVEAQSGRLADAGQLAERIKLDGCGAVIFDALRDRDHVVAVDHIGLRQANARAIVPGQDQRFVRRQPSRSGLPGRVVAAIDVARRIDPAEIGEIGLRRIAW